MDWEYSMHERDDKIYTFVQNLWKEDHLEDSRWEINIRVELNELDGMVWTGFIWLRTGTSGELLWTR
jgi:hypothetical protein